MTFKCPGSNNIFFSLNIKLLHQQQRLPKTPANSKAKSSYPLNGAGGIYQALNKPQLYIRTSTRDSWEGQGLATLYLCTQWVYQRWTLVFESKFACPLFYLNLTSKAKVNIAPEFTGKVLTKLRISMGKTHIVYRTLNAYTHTLILPGVDMSKSVASEWATNPSSSTRFEMVTFSSNIEMGAELGFLCSAW